MIRMIWVLAATLMATQVVADEATIKAVQVDGTGGVYTFSVTLEHADTGWEDYADGWRVELEDGAVLGTRVLYHPHVTEQPFTRSLSGVAVPDGVKKVFVRAKTLPEAWGESRFEVTLP